MQKSEEIGTNITKRPACIEAPVGVNQFLFFFFFILIKMLPNSRSQR